MVVKAVKCPNCESFVYLRSVEDVRGCPCKSVTVVYSKGLKVVKREDIEEELKFIPVEISATREDLQYDFMLQTNMLGVIENIYCKKRGFREEKRMLPVVYREGRALL